MVNRPDPLRLVQTRSDGDPEPAALGLTTAALASSRTLGREGGVSFGSGGRSDLSGGRTATATVISVGHVGDGGREGSGSHGGWRRPRTSPALERSARHTCCCEEPGNRVLRRLHVSVGHLPFFACTDMCDQRGLAGTRERTEEGI